MTLDGAWLVWPFQRECVYVCVAEWPEEVTARQKVSVVESEDGEEKPRTESVVETFVFEPPACEAGEMVELDSPAPLKGGRKVCLQQNERRAKRQTRTRWKENELGH